MNCWITTHWPSPHGFEVARNVYYKAGRAKLPRVGDLMLIYEAETATVDGQRKSHAILHHRRRRERVELPKGRGRIISCVTVSGPPRQITEDDRVYEYGNLKEWSLIPCVQERPVRDVSRGQTMELLGKPATTPPRFWSLWKVPDSHVPRLVHRILLSDGTELQIPFSGCGVVQMTPAMSHSALLQIA
ncbi:MAG TPA: hypothetical protein VK797_03670 [Tepidisphaeraceae bacterium]|nr:hypothetical protein [Tepidisphaeraceae bacterium]